ncbi:MAG: hypothetical protein PHU75_01925 [Candidatus Nanopelagicales bacterium]|nr:hypothetical protein [Candidatus Nanopelagicales bacterium]
MDEDVIPWLFTDSPGVLMWHWVTEHFAATIRGLELEADGLQDGQRNVRSYTWELADLIRSNQGIPRLLVEGRSREFDDAERRIREHVGKCYDPQLGYRGYAGPHAWTFALASGEEVDVREYRGSRCSVTVLMPDGSERTVAGDFSVDRYRWTLSTPDGRMEIVPEHVVRITNRSEAATRATQLARHSTYSGVGRLYREEPGPGCTGRPGFMVGTVDHVTPERCPVHEGAAVPFITG